MSGASDNVQRYQLLVGSREFLDSALADIAAGRDRVFIQAMTFEGDAAGREIAGAVAASQARDRRVLVDDYTRNVINDTILPLPFRPRAVRGEAKATLEMFDDLVGHGVRVRITNPVLGNPLRYPLRNHKKLLVIDDLAYIGGINFSDHNFAWHDLMLRIADPQIADWLAADFGRDWQGRPAGAGLRFGDCDLVTLDGTSNEARLEPLLDLIAGARETVEMISPYPTMPFIESMASAARRGVAVTIHTPRPNNKPLVRDYLCGVADAAGIAVRLLPSMTHVKALLVDGEALVFGSSNFNFATYRTSNDIVATIRDPQLVTLFEHRVLEQARAAGVDAGSAGTTRWQHWRGRMAIRMADAALARLRHGPVRAIDWPERQRR